jgi:hypothetical protein
VVLFIFGRGEYKLKILKFDILKRINVIFRKKYRVYCAKVEILYNSIYIMSHMYSSFLLSETANGGR